MEWSISDTSCSLSTQQSELAKLYISIVVHKTGCKYLAGGVRSRNWQCEDPSWCQLSSKLALLALLCRHLVGICKWKIMVILKIDCGASFGILVVARAILYLWLSSYKILFQQHFFFLLVKEYSEFSIKSPENFKIGRLGMVVYAYIFSTWDLNVRRSGVQVQL